MKKIIYSLIPVIGILSTPYVHAEHSYKKVVKEKYLTNICFSLGTSYKKISNPRGWQKGLEKAIEKYNDLFEDFNSNINFCSTPLGSSAYKPSHQVYLKFVYAGYNAGWYARAGTPNWRGKPKSKITFNINKISDMYDTDTKAGLIMHEMGHLLGLCHTHDYFKCKPINETENDYNWQNSLYVDADYNTTFRQPVFTEADRDAMESLYK